MKKNRIISILLITTMLLALIPIIPVNAIAVSTTDGVYNDDIEDYVDRGDYGDLIIVEGTGVTAGESVRIGWDGLQAWDGEKGILNSTTAKGSGAFEVWFDVPSAVAGNHYLWLKDMETGDTYMYSNPFVVKPKIKFSPSSGLVDDKITMSGYGFSDEEDIDPIIYEDGYGNSSLTTTPATPESDELGHWECTFKVPHDEYGKWKITATDESAVTGSGSFTIGAAITLDPEVGPVGTVVEITGRGYTEGQDIDTGDVTIDGVEAKVIKDDVVDEDGEFKIEVVIPQVGDVDEYDLIVKENATGVSGDEEFDVTGLAEIEIEPEFGVQGSTVTIEGWNFTQISGKEIEIWLAWQNDTLISEISDNLDTESDGDFVGSFTIPAKSGGKYHIMALMDTYNINATAGFRIGLMIVIPTPTSGPTGTEVTITGTGFTEGGTWNATFGDYDIVEDDDGDVTGGSDLELDGDVPTFYVPTVDPGTYTISIYDIDAELSVDVDYTVTATTMAEFDPMTAPNEYNVSISGVYFNADSDENDVELEFVLYNVTSDGEKDEEWEIDVYVGPKNSTTVAELDDDGNFTGWWVIDDSDEMSLGDYIRNVTASDADNIMAQAYLSIVEKAIDVETRKTSFSRGETVAFDVWSSFAQEDSYIEIYDPAGDLYWTTNEFEANMWLKVGTLQTVPYYYQTAGGNQLLLLEDAALGTWSWEWYDDDDDELSTGTYTVTESPANVLSEMMTELQGDLTDLSADFSSVSSDVSTLTSDVASLSTSVAQAIAAANAASDAVQDVATAVASVADTANNAATAATNAAAAATSAKDAADSAGAAASGLTNLVYGAIVAALVAALAAIVSLMQISKKIA
jgi:hypothetical protein